MSEIKKLIEKKKIVSEQRQSKDNMDHIHGGFLPIYLGKVDLSPESCVKNTTTVGKIWNLPITKWDFMCISQGFLGEQNW